MMQRDSAEQHKNHISNLVSNDINELGDKKNQSILEGDSLGLRANSSDIKVMSNLIALSVKIDIHK